MQTSQGGAEVIKAKIDISGRQQLTTQLHRWVLAAQCRLLPSMHPAVLSGFFKTGTECRQTSTAYLQPFQITSAYSTQDGWRSILRVFCASRHAYRTQAGACRTQAHANSNSMGMLNVILCAVHLHGQSSLVRARGKFGRCGPSTALQLQHARLWVPFAKAWFSGVKISRCQVAAKAGMG